MINMVSRGGIDRREETAFWRGLVYVLMAVSLTVYQTVLLLKVFYIASRSMDEKRCFTIPL